MTVAYKLTILKKLSVDINPFPVKNSSGIIHLFSPKNDTLSGCITFVHCHPRCTNPVGTILYNISTNIYNTRRSIRTTGVIIKISINPTLKTSDIVVSTGPCFMRRISGFKISVHITHIFKIMIAIKRIIFIAF